MFVCVCVGGVICIQAHLSWDGVVPVNVSLSLNKQWQTNSSRGQACALFTAQQVGKYSANLS